MKSGTFKDISGTIFGRLTAKEFAGYYHNPSGKRAAKWTCVCTCGKTLDVLAANLSAGKATSCGCLRSEQKSEAWMRHGHASGKIDGKRQRTGTYRSWMAMRERCLKNTHRQFQSYGGRGITVCEAWNTFENFLADMGERPEGTSIDRIDNDGNYEPGNCRWATSSEQGNNRRTCRMLEIDGETLSVALWSKRSGIDARTIIQRLNRGWTEERAAFAPPMEINR